MSNLEKIQQLKAHVYDCLAQRQAIDTEIAQSNQRIAELSQEDLNETNPAPAQLDNSEAFKENGKALQREADPVS